MTKIIDISRKIYNGMEVFPGQPSVRIENHYGISKQGRNLEKVSLTTHCATHIDAPYHFIENGLTAENIPLNSIIGKVLLIDLTHKKRGGQINLSDLQPYQAKIQKIRKIVLRTDWNQKGRAYYIDYPFLSIEACKFLSGLKIEMLAMDTPSPGPVGKDGETIHKLLLSNNIYIIEGLTNLDLIKENQFLFVCLPLNLKGTSGSPCRTIALLI